MADRVHERTERLGSLIERLREHGHRVGAPRRAVLDALVSSEHHPGAEDLFAAARAIVPSVGRATVYKTLDMLRSLDEVLVLEFRDGQSSGNRYDGFRPGPHPHLICTACGTIEDVTTGSIAPLLRDAEQRTGYQVEHYRLDLYGKCRSCHEGTDASEGALMVASQAAHPAERG